MPTRRHVLGSSAAAMLAAVLPSAAIGSGREAPAAVRDLTAAMTRRPTFDLLVGSRRWIAARIDEAASAQAAQGRNTVLVAEAGLPATVLAGRDGKASGAAAGPADFQDLSPRRRWRSLVSHMRLDPHGIAIHDVNDTVFETLQGMNGALWATNMAFCGFDVIAGVPSDDPDEAMARVVVGTRPYQWAGVRVLHEHVGDVTGRFLAISAAA